MNITLVLMLIAAVSFALAVKFFKRQFEWKFIGIFAIVFIGIALLGFYSGKAGKTLDVEIWNGEVTSKSQEKVSCSHSYDCNCKNRTSCSGSGSNRTCSTRRYCDTCYEHSHDFNWVVRSNIGNLDIDRVDRQGVKTPPRWAAVKVGEPFSKEHLHTNYIKGVPESIFHASDKLASVKFANLIPAYPKQVHDYYRINRAISVGVPVSDLQQWSDDISIMLKQLGPQKQANVVIVFVKTNDPQYEYALRSAWLGAKKNDIVVIAGSVEYPKIDFIRILSWTDKEFFKVTLRDNLQALETIDRVKFIETIRVDTLKEFKRKSMKDFEYLDNEIEPPDWVIYLTLGIMLVIFGFVSFGDKIKTPNFSRRSKYSYR